MRKSVLALFAAGSAVAVAAPASAQYYPQADRYGYGANQYYDNIRGLQRRIYNALGTINSAPYDQQYRLRSEAIGLDRELRYAARNGLSPYEAESIGTRVQRLEFRVQRAAQYGRYGYNRSDGYNGEYGYGGRRDRDDRRHRDDDRDDD